jgi:hypothetical protein
VATSRAGNTVHTARESAELAPLRPLWETVPWPRVEADLDFFPLTLDASSGARPYAVAVERDGRVVAASIGRLEQTTLPAKLGYRTLYAPRVRSLTVPLGGSTASDDDAASALLDELHTVLRRGEADVLSLLGLKVDSPLHRAALSHAGVRRRELFARRTQHWRLELPQTYDAFLASRSKSTRESVRRYGKKLEQTFGERLRLDILAESGDLGRILEDLDVVAAKTYQAGLGVAFANAEEQRRKVTLGLERGWFRAWVLYVDGQPVAFWPGYVYNRTFTIGIPGYDPAYAEHRVGTYVQMRLIADLCADDAVDAIDYGRGDAEYKRRFGSESWEEQDVVAFAPTLRAMRVNATRNAVVGAGRGAQAALAKVGLADKIKKRWRERLRRVD